MKIKKLKHEIKKNGYDYLLIQESPKCKIYQQSDNGIIVGFEIFKIQLAKLHPQSSDFTNFDKMERFPTDESFGKWAWFYKNYNQAVLKLKQIES